MELSPDSPPASSRIQSAAHSGPFADRQDAMNLIHERLDAIQKGHGQRLGIESPSGIGKSRLAWEAIEAAQAHGVTPILVPCRGSTLRPYDPLDLLVRALLEVDSAQSLDVQRDIVRGGLAALMLGDLTGAMLRLLRLPGADSEDGDTAPSEEFSPYDTIILSEDINLPDAILRILTHWGAFEKGRSLLLIFDDLDQASELTRVVFASMLRSIENLPVFALGTFVPNAPVDVHAMFEGRTFALKPLAREDVQMLAREMLDASRIGPELAEFLWSVCDGHPLETRLTLRYLDRNGYLLWDEESGAVTITDMEAEPGIPDIFAGQVEALPEGPRAVLRLAAVLGNGMRIGALRTLREQDGPVTEQDLTDDLATLVEGGWLETSGAARLAAYRFGSRLTHEMVLQSIHPDKLAVLHRRAGDYYAVPATGLHLRTDSAITHYLAGRERERALTVLDMTINDARRSNDRERLIALYRRGVEISRPAPSIIHRQAAYASALGDLYAAAGDYASAIRSYRDLVPVDSPYWLLGKLALASLMNDPTQTAEQLAYLLENVPPESDLRWQIEAAFAWALALTGEEVDAIKLMRDGLAALEGAPGQGDARTLLRGTLGMVMQYHGQADGATAHLESARDGWAAKGREAGVLLMNQVLANTPRKDVNRSWLVFMMSLIQPEGDAG